MSHDAQTPALSVDASPGRPLIVQGRVEHCANCATPINGHFCSHCGQAAHVHRASFGHFMQHFIGHYVALDGALARTLRQLLVPGALSVAYLAGQRQRYIDPLRLYLSFSFVLFLLFSLYAFLEITPAGPSFSLSTTPQTYGAAPLSPAEIDALQQRWTAKSEHQNAAERWLQKRMIEITKQSPGTSTVLGVGARLPYALMLLPPLLAWVLRALYWRRPLRYGEHAVVALHIQTALFALIIVSTQLNQDWLTAAAAMAGLTYIALTMRRVYAGSLRLHVLRVGLLVCAYLAFTSIIVIGLIAFSLLS